METPVLRAFLVLLPPHSLWLMKLSFNLRELPYPKNRTGFSSIGTGDEAVAIFHLKPGPNMPTILGSHGNAQNLKSLKLALGSFHIKGFGVISYDYPGYGESGGKTT